MVLEQASLRVRGTFIDFCPEAIPSIRRRSSSAPPAQCIRRGVHDVTTHQSHDEYLATLVRKVQEGIPRDCKIQPAQDSPTASTVDSSEKKFMCVDIFEEAGQDDLPCTQHEDNCNEYLGEITTLMIADIPCRKSIEDVIELIDSLGFTNTYNLVYMPSRMRPHGQGSLTNIGYGFVNFKTAQLAAEFGHAFKNIVFPNSATKKISYTKPARCQGFEANVAQYHSKSRGRLRTFA